MTARSAWRPLVACTLLARIWSVTVVTCTSLASACSDNALERKLLAVNPITTVKWKAPRTTHEVDRRCVVNHRQARLLLDAVDRKLPSGPRIMPFYAVIYYAGLRPEEAVNLRRHDLRIPALIKNQATGETEEPDGNWGELRFCSVATEIGAEWTDHGTRRDHRQLKARARGEWR